jgi:beta-lactamase class A
MKISFPVFVVSVLLGMLIGGSGVYIAMQVPPSVTLTGALREDITNYRFIDPLLACNPPEATSGRYKELDDSLLDLVAKIKEEERATTVSLYFQEYPSGRWVGIDESHQYEPASLLKIVLMIAYFRDEELHPGSLQKTYAYTKEHADIHTLIPFDADSALEVGKKYTADELIRSMIIDSDNGAKNVLLDNVNQSTIEAVYRDLKIPAPSAVSTYTISPRQYSLFFRILYNATYLSRASSEKAMSILAQAKYSDGLVAGLPKNVTVAHKFVEHVNGDPTKGIDSVELHDCGLVYGPNLPYFLCVMTTGKSLTGLQSAIQDISRTVYTALDTNISPQN